MGKGRYQLDYNIVNKYFPILFFIQPFIYLLASLTNHYDTKYFSYEFYIYLIIILFSLIYIFKFTKSKYSSFSRNFIILIFMYAFLFSFNMFLTKELHSFLNELRFLFNYIFFPIIFLTFLNLFEEKTVKINVKILIIPFCIMGGVILLAHLTNTQFYSYLSNKLGYMGWFNAANRLSNIVAILSPVIIYTIINNRNNFKYYLLLFLHIYVSLILGTKTPVIGLLISIMGFIFIYVYKMLSEKKNYFNIIMMPLMLYLFVTIIFLPFSPTGRNLNIHLSELNLDEYSELGMIENRNKLNNFLLSSRDIYFKNSANYFINDSINNQFLGKGYINSQNELYKWVEIDFYDVLFNFGIIGLILYLYLFFKIFILVFSDCVKNVFSIVKNIELMAYLMAVILGLLISVTAGYIFIYPKISIYMALLIVFFLVKIKGQINNKN